MTCQSKQWAVTALNTAEEQPTSQEIEEARKLKRHWTRKYPQRELELFSDISGKPIEDLIKEAVDEWIEAHANEYIAKHKAEQIALHEQALTELRNS